MPKLKIKNGDVIIVPGTGGADVGTDSGFMPFGSTAKTKSADFTFAEGGLYVLSNSSGIGLTGTLPAASSNPGVRYMVVCNNADTHLVTASNDTAGDDPLANYAGSDITREGGLGGVDAGEALEFGGDTASVVIIESTSANWQIVSVSSGSNGVLFQAGDRP